MGGAGGLRRGAGASGVLLGLAVQSPLPRKCREAQGGRLCSACTVLRRMCFVQVFGSCAHLIYVSRCQCNFCVSSSLSMPGCSQIYQGQSMQQELLCCESTWNPCKDPCSLLPSPLLDRQSAPAFYPWLSDDNAAWRTSEK